VKSPGASMTLVRLWFAVGKFTTGL
jgi:hypothetical protein